MLASRRNLADTLRPAPQGLELRHLRYLAAVADAGTFTHAAERLFIAQPTLSQQIGRLEQLVGTRLLHRHRDGVQLTAAGTVLLGAARDVLSAVVLAFAATADRPTAVLTDPTAIAGPRPGVIRLPRPATPVTWPGSASPATR
jgi:DNA-binding transcriptional LysR family regulator